MTLNNLSTGQKKRNPAFSCSRRADPFGKKAGFFVHPNFLSHAQLKNMTWLCLIFICLPFVPSTLNADSTSDFVEQRVEFPSSPNPVGSGARALGMGGAFIAIADDATAASWNPGGLIQLEHPELALVGAAFHRIDENTFGTNPEASGSQPVSKVGLNYLSATCPFTLWNRNMVVSVNYQNLYDFTRKWNHLLTEETSSADYDYELKGSLSAFGIAYAIQIVSEFSIGFTLNLWEDGIYDNEWEERRHRKGAGTNGGGYSFETHSLDRYSFSGVNANLGLLWRMNDNITLGAVLKTPFKADLAHEHSFYGRIDYASQPPKYDVSVSHPPERKHATMEMPISYGIGVAYKFSDLFMVSLDIYRTEWDDFTLKNSEGIEMSPVTGKRVGESESPDPTHQVRIGAEHVFTNSKHKLAICGGIFYDPSPSEGVPDNFFGFSLGSGFKIKGVVFDLAYQYRFGNNVGSAILKSRGFSQDVAEHTVYSSVVIHF